MRALALVLPVLLLIAVPLRAQEGEPLFVFGVMADVQYADKAAAGKRHYRASLALLEKAVAAMNTAAPAFVVQLGDFVDGGEENLERVLAHWKKLRPPAHHVLGNHDYYAKRPQVLKRFGLPAAHYSFARAGWRFVVLEAMAESLLGEPSPGDKARARARLDELVKAGEPNATPWNGGLGKAQREWLAATLSAADAAGERVLIFCHLPVHAKSASAVHLLWDHVEVRALIAKHACVQAWFNGHDHAGGYAHEAGIHYLTFPGMVEAPKRNAFALVEVHAERLVVRGHGAVPDRTLALRPVKKSGDRSGAAGGGR